MYIPDTFSFVINYVKLVNSFCHYNQIRERITTECCRTWIPSCERTVEIETNFKYKNSNINPINGSEYRHSLSTTILKTIRKSTVSTTILKVWYYGLSFKYSIQLMGIDIGNCRIMYVSESVRALYTVSRLSGTSFNLSFCLTDFLIFTSFFVISFRASIVNTLIGSLHNILAGSRLRLVALYLQLHVIPAIVEIVLNCSV